eukprot:CAMPEP_0171852510 /NCGR_PEP_ID=MMETSP0992-20121227/21688_1 /TAXON_ID=483369 /ORGANISM="non described non described, Strain CCMP2098" /LENGTH=63 /DNA_ID=CAMNT_0012472671 /DNA_START=106 /DNA_END=294 /DNA_ORIENTATION=+
MPIKSCFAEGDCLVRFLKILFKSDVLMRPPERSRSERTSRSVMPPPTDDDDDVFAAEAEEEEE